MSRTVLITGSTGGLGLAVASALGRSGHTVIVSGRTPGRVASAVAELQASGIDADGRVLDVSSFESARCAADGLRARYGHLDVLVNNAGILPEATAAGDVEFIHPSAAAQTFATNTLGALYVIEAMLPLLRRSDAGRIVNVSSTVGSLREQEDPQSQYFSTIVPAYQASKAALNSITIGLSKLLADSPIKVTSVCPGYVQTDLTPGNKTQAPLTAAEAAEVVVRAALLPDTATSGTFVDAGGPVRW
ncbi:MAG: short-chain dehydrogenase [Gordonia sp.]|nr:short-chain dehydrogenase [Gordonia sp. (in: high G+C Gram-positive bacteria)]